MKVADCDIIYEDDVRTYNTYEQPNNITAKKASVNLGDIELPPHSLIRIVLEK